MPAHLFAAGLLTTAALTAGQDCTENDDDGGDEEGGPSSLASAIRTRPNHETEDGEADLVEAERLQQQDEDETQHNNNNKSVRFHSSSDPTSVRSIQAPEGSARFGNNSSSSHSIHYTSEGGIRLCRSAPNRATTTAAATTNGFVNGDFRTGKLKDVETSSNCYNMAYHPDRSTRLLAVGQRDGLCFYETTMYSLVHKVPTTNGMISTVEWCCLPSSSSQQYQRRRGEGGFRSLIVAGTLDGTVSLYRVDEIAILESLGPTLLHRFQLDGQIRAMECTLFGKLEPSFVVACGTKGTKGGKITLTSFTYGTRDGGGDDLDPIQASVSLDLPSAVLGLCIHSKLGKIAWSTKSGNAIVHNLRRTADSAVVLDEKVWSTDRSSPVRCVAFTKSGHQLVFGGYDKTVVIVDTKLWAICRELPIQGTVNTISLDDEERYLTVGSRDKAFRVFDTSTYLCIKTFHTPGWVTSVSWEPTNYEDDNDVVAVRTESKCISVLNLSSIRMANIRMSSRHGMNSSVSWSRDGRVLARSSGSHVVIADALDSFRDVARLEVNGLITKVTFSHAPSNSTNAVDEQLLAAIDSKGSLTLMRMYIESSKVVVERICARQIAEESLMALAWSPDGRFIATGGREHLLHVISVPDLKAVGKPLEIGSRVWDIDLVSQEATSTTLMAVSLGDYSALIFNGLGSDPPILQVRRLRTARCLSFHPKSTILAVGDGAGTVAIVDFDEGEIVHELCVNGRVNTVCFSPIGDYLLVGTDDCKFSMHETSSYHCLQQIDSEGFALTGEFSPVGSWLALGSAAESYSLISLGPFLSIDLIPLAIEGGFEKLPRSAANEALFRSSYGPSFVQRHMISGGPDNLRRVVKILREHPDSIYAFDRRNNEGCFDTALRLKRPNLLKLAVTILVDGTLDKSCNGQRTILTTEIPQLGRNSLIDICNNLPQEFIVSILEEMRFTKVPFTEPHSVEARSQRCYECASSSFMDPWGDRLNKQHKHYLPKPKSANLNGQKKRDRNLVSLTPAVLPLPGLCDLEFLNSLLCNSPPDVFDNRAMRLVLSVMWRKKIRKYFVLDCLGFGVYFACWVALLEFNLSGTYTGNNSAIGASLSFVVITINSLYLIKEVIQSARGQRLRYFLSLWNISDLASILCVYGYVFVLFFNNAGHTYTPLAVVTTLLLTVKLLSYLRGFSDTGWLISVLIANFRDVRGFLVILLSILVGFSVAFRLLFGESGVENGFESLRRSLLSTFEMTILGEYDSSLLYDARYSVLSALTFTLAVTCVLVVALNALISILADSYAKVQENSTANRRRERASLIAEYMTLLPKKSLRRIERSTQWFHILVETDADGDLLEQKEDWLGGLNAVRKDMEELEERTRDNQQKLTDQVKNEMKHEISKVTALLEDLSEEMKKLQTLQSEGGVTFSGKNVAKAVKAVKSIHKKGGSLFK